MESAVRAGMTRVSSASELGTKDSRSANAFWEAARDATFWQRTGQLKRLVEPMKTLAS